MFASSMAIIYKSARLSFGSKNQRRRYISRELSLNFIVHSLLHPLLFEHLSKFKNFHSCKHYKQVSNQNGFVILNLKNSDGIK